MMTRSPLPIPRSDRKSTRLNSSHTLISYAVFCLKKKHNSGWEGEKLTRWAAGSSEGAPPALPLDRPRELRPDGPRVRRRPRDLLFFFFLMARAPTDSPPFPPTAALPI